MIPEDFESFGALAALAVMSPEELAAVQSGLTVLATHTLANVLRDKRAPAAARVSAANSVLDRAERQAERNRDPAEKELSELTLLELDALVRQIELKRSAASAQDAQVLEHRPHNPLTKQ